MIDFVPHIQSTAFALKLLQYSVSVPPKSIQEKRKSAYGDRISNHDSLERWLKMQWDRV